MLSALRVVYRREAQDVAWECVVFIVEDIAVERENFGPTSGIPKLAESDGGEVFAVAYDVEIEGFVRGWCKRGPLAFDFAYEMP